MATNENIDRKIDDYLLSKLSIKEMKDFELSMTKDSTLRSKVKKQEKIIKGLETYGRRELKKELIDIHNKIYNKKTASYFKIISVIAVLVLGLLFSYYFINKNNKISSASDLYYAYFQPYNYSNNNRAESNESLFTLGVLYNQKKYEEFIGRSNNLNEEKENLPSDLLLAISIAHLETDNTTVALEYLNLINQKKDFNYFEEVKWYSAMAYLKDDNLKEAQTILKYFIDQKDSYYHDQSVKLEKSIQRLIVKN